MSFDRARAIDLIVAAGPGGVLNTASPLPTDGRAHHYACDRCQTRVLVDDVRCRACGSDQLRPDGPFPVTVGRWEEIHQCSWCGVYAESGARDGRLHVCKADPTLTGSAHTFGAIVQTGVVSGPSHQADGCWGTTIREGSDPARPWYCHPDGEYGMYHTSVEWKDPLDVPVPSPRAAGWCDLSGYNAPVAEWWAPLPARTEPS